MSEETKIFASRLMTIFKLSELVLAIICVGLIVDPINHKMQLNMHHVAMVYATYSGFIIINTVAIIGHMKDGRMPKYTWALFALAGGSLFLATGSIIIDDWRNLWIPTEHMGYSKQYMDMMIASGIIAIFNAFIYFTDCGLSVAFG